VISAPPYLPARAAWLTAFVIEHPEVRFARLEGAPRADYAAVLARSDRPRQVERP
jgi:hypothetical protein